MIIIAGIMTMIVIVQSELVVQDHLFQNQIIKQWHSNLHIYHPTLLPLNRIRRIMVMVHLIQHLMNTRVHLIHHHLVNTRDHPIIIHSTCHSHCHHHPDHLILDYHQVVIRKRFILHPGLYLLFLLGSNLLLLPPPHPSLFPRPLPHPRSLRLLH